VHKKLLLKIASVTAVKDEGGVVFVDRQVEGIATIAISWQ
jgi:hypothetical protein